MADRTYGLLGSVASPPGPVARVSAFLARAVQPVFGEQRVLRGVLVATRAVGLGAIAVGAARVYQRRHFFQMSRVNAVAVTAQLLDVIQLHAVADSAYQELPYKPVSQRTLPFPVRKSVAIFSDGIPQPASVITKGDLPLKSLGQMFEEMQV